MKPQSGLARLLLIIAILLGVLGGVVGIFREVRNGAERGKKDRAEERSADEGGNSRKAEQRQNKTPRDPRLKQLFSEDNYFLKVDSLRDFLAKHNNDPASLATAFILTGDPWLLEELKKHPNDPNAAVTLAVLSDRAEDRFKFAEVYAKLKPEEITGHLLYANEIKSIIEQKKKKGERTEAEERQLKETMKNAMSASTFNAGLEANVTNLREALASTGMDPVETEAYLLTNDRVGMEIIGDCAGALIAGYDIEANEILKSKNPDTEVAIEAASYYLGQAELFGDISGYVYDRGRSAEMNMKLQILKRLPEKAILPGQAKSVKDLLNDLRSSRRTYAEDRSRAYLALHDASPQTVDAFMEIARTSGLTEAESWLLKSSP